jgi:choline-glycine betaine transporter
VFHLVGAWRWIYVGGAVIALYFNVFVLIVQAFQKIAPLKALAPTQTEPPFVVVQIAALLFFVGVGVASIRRFLPPASA